MTATVWAWNGLMQVIGALAVVLDCPCAATTAFATEMQVSGAQTVVVGCGTGGGGSLILSHAQKSAATPSRPTAARV